MASAKAIMMIKNVRVFASGTGQGMTMWVWEIIPGTIFWQFKPAKYDEQLKNLLNTKGNGQRPKRTHKFWLHDFRDQDNIVHGYDNSFSPHILANYYKMACLR